MFIQLTQDRFALIDDEDIPLVGGCAWYPMAQHNGKFYAQNADRQLMHRLILGAMPGQIVDHINHDGLDNRRCNLRFVTASQNQWHSRPGKRNKSGYKGVCFDKTHGRWKARIQALGKKHHLGNFPSPQAAALAYDRAALALHGEFARLNFPSLHDPIVPLLPRPVTISEAQR